jgi:hypothetical protein
MTLTNKLKNQVDIPVWEWTRFLPTASGVVSSTAAADNSIYHVNHGRYIYFLQGATTVAGGIGTGTGFYRYDTVSDTFQQLSFPPVAPATFSGMEFSGGYGYYGRVLSGGINTITAAALTGQILKTYDIKIIGGTGVGQHRIITGVSDPIIVDNGTFTVVQGTPQANVTDANKNWVINQWVGYQVRFIANTGQTQTRKVLYNSSNTIYFGDVNKYAEDVNAYPPIVAMAGTALPVAAAGTQYQIEYSTITVDTPWTTIPDATSRFIVHSGAIWLLSAGTTSYLLEYYDIAADTWYERNGFSNTSPATANGTDGTIVVTGEVATVYDRGTATSATGTTLVDTTQNWPTNLATLGYKVRIFSGTGLGQVRPILSNTATSVTVASWTTQPDTTSQYLIDMLESGTATSGGNSAQTVVSTASISGNIMTVTAMTSGSFLAGQILTGTGVQSNITVTSTEFACYTAGLNTTVIVSQGGTTGIVSGMYVTKLDGTGTLAIGCTVTGVTSTTVTLSAAPTLALQAATLQFATAYVSSALGSSSNGTTVTVGSTTGIQLGMVPTVLAGTGSFAAGTYVTSIVDSTHFVVSIMPVALSAATVLCQPYQTIISNQLSGTPGGVGTYNIWPAQSVTSTTITGTGIASLTDTSKIWSPHRWNGQSVRIIAGTGMGQVRSIVGTKGNNTISYTSAAGATSSGTTITVGSTASLVAGMIVTVTAGTGSLPWNTSVVSVTDLTHFVISATPTVALSGGSTVVVGTADNTIFVVPNWTTTPDSTSVYVIHGDSDKLYFSMATQTPTFIQNIDSDMVTMGRMLDYGVTRSVAAQYSDQNAISIASGVPVFPINYALGTGTVYTSAASATSSGAVVTVGTTAGLYVGCPVTVAGGTGTFAANSYVLVVNSATTFTLSATPTIALSGAAIVTGTVSALTFFGMGPFQTSTTSGTGTTATITFTTLPGSTYTGSTTLPVGSMITVMGVLPAGYNGTYAVTASSAGSVSYANATTGAQTTAGMLSQGAINQIGATSCTIYGCIPSGYNGAQTVTAAGAGFVAYANATVGQLTATGYFGNTALATTSCTIASTTATFNFAGTTTNFGVGSYITVTGVTTVAAGTGNYNGVFQVVSAGTGTLTCTISSSTPSGTASAQGTIQLASPTILCQTTNSHNYQKGQSITFSGDMQWASANTNITTTVTPVAGVLNQFVYTASSAAGTMILFSQTSGSILFDCTKNWVPNQFANCIVTYNSTQYAGLLTGGNALSAYILANTSNKLIFTAAQGTAPSVGVSRYVITMPQTSQNNATLGSCGTGLALGTEAVGQIQDNTTYWAFPANVSSVAAAATSGSATQTVASLSGIFVGMNVAITVNTAGNLTLPYGTTVTAMNTTGPTVTFSNATAGGTGGSTTFTFFATCNSSGNTVTVSGYTTQGLQVGMYLGVNSIDNIKNTSYGTILYNVTGAFTPNGGTALTPVYVTAINSATSFTISSTPTIPLVNANVTASLWFANQWVGRRVRLLNGTSTNYLEQTCSTSTTAGIMTFGTAFGFTPVSQVTAYSILQQPNRGLGTNLMWNFGQSDYTKRAIYLYQARGGGSTGFDRLNLATDTWEFLTATPNFEVLQTGAMYAYDAQDRLYFTPQITQRVYYLDLPSQQIIAAGQYPYTAGTAIIGNRMEIFTTADGLKYLWLNRHQNQESFKQLLFY